MNGLYGQPIVSIRKNIVERQAYYCLAFALLIPLTIIDFQGFYFIVMLGALALNLKLTPVVTAAMWCTTVVTIICSFPVIVEFDLGWRIAAFCVAIYSLFKLRDDLDLIGTAMSADVRSTLKSFFDLYGRMKDYRFSISSEGIRQSDGMVVSGERYNKFLNWGPMEIHVVPCDRYKGYYRFTLNKVPLWFKTLNEDGTPCVINKDNILEMTSKGAIRSFLNKELDVRLADFNIAKHQFNT